MSVKPATRFTRCARWLRRQSSFVLFLLGMVIFRTAVADWNYVPSGSMEPSLYAGDYLWINKLAYGPAIPFTHKRLWSAGEPERGDIITFYPSHTDDQLVKRVVGIPGDTVEIHGQQLTINGVAVELQMTDSDDQRVLAEEHLPGVNHAVQFSRQRPLTQVDQVWVIPEGHYFVLGDHRNNSNDSRYWGFVRQDQIIGHATHVAVSFSSRRPWSERIALALE